MSADVIHESCCSLLFLGLCVVVHLHLCMAVLIHSCVLPCYMCDHSCHTASLALPCLCFMHTALLTRHVNSWLWTCLRFDVLEIHRNTEIRISLCVALLLHWHFDVLEYCHNNILTSAPLWYLWDHVYCSVSKHGACIVQLFWPTNHCLHLHHVFCSTIWGVWGRNTPCYRQWGPPHSH